MTRDTHHPVVYLRRAGDPPGRLAVSREASSRSRSSDR